MNRGETEKQILLIDPSQSFGQVLQKVLGDGHTLRRVCDVASGIRLLASCATDVVLLNVEPQPSADNTEDPFALLRAASAMSAAPPVIAYGWDAYREKAMLAFQLGAAEFLEQPLNVHDLKNALVAAYRQAALSRELAAVKKSAASSGIEGLLGASAVMQPVHEMVRKVASVSTTVLITGESGTGKEVVARSIHRLSDRGSKPFVAFSGCSFPESLVEDELFGHEKGAFTGAGQGRRGRFEEAAGGTIFLDEIGDLSLPLQSKLLRVLQERIVERLGSGVSHPVDVRVLCATNRNLEKMVREGKFREDLYFRVSVVKVHMPPLRDRADDIPLLAEYFLREFSRTHRKDLRGLTPGFLSLLAKHNWPGNVRELQNVMERCVVLADGNSYLTIADLSPELRGLPISDFAGSSPFHRSVRSLKRELVRWALRRHGGNKLRAAKDLGISRCYLHRLLGQLGIPDEPANEEGPLPELAGDLGKDMEEDLAADLREEEPASLSVV